MKESKIDIVACTDKWFVMPTGVMMYSVCVNNPDVDIVFHVFYDDSVTSKNRRDLEKTVAGFGGKSIAFYHVDLTKFPYFPDIIMVAYVSQATYFRLMLSEILPETIHKVLYLDGDIIVRHSLLPLWNTDLKGYAVGAVPDIIEIEYSKEYSSRLNYPSQHGYFNSGVLLVNLEYWRKHRVVRDLLSYLQEHADILEYSDQDLLNALFYDKKVVLPIKYNLICGFMWSSSQYDFGRYEKEIQEALKDPVIVHFTGGKPWQQYSRLPQHPFSSTFFKYQGQTRWKGVKIDKRSFKLRVINYVADTLRKYGLKSQVSPEYEYIEIASID